MKITAIETVQVGAYPNVLFVHVYTDGDAVGLGETFFGADAVAAYIHERVAPALVGQDALAIDRHADALRNYVGYAGSGVEVRGNSAIDIALWDLFGEAVQQPLCQLLGGSYRDSIKVYNTCAGYEYVRHDPDWSVDNWGLPTTTSEEHPYEDLQAFLQRPADLARSLLGEGITAMKIWPLDAYATESGGHYLSNADLRKGLEPFAAIREAVGDEIDIALELHGLWSVPMAKRIVAAVEEFQPMWVEDAVRPDDLSGLEEIARATTLPLTASETLAGRWAFRELFERRAASIVMLDLGWAGGVSEARKIAAMAEAYHLPVTPHDCTGPVVWAASTHLAMNLPNAMVQEFVRAYYHSWYPELAAGLPKVERGRVQVGDAPGHGVSLRAALRDRSDVTRRTTGRPPDGAES